MNIFVAYGYNPRDQWIKERVSSIIGSFGSTVITGEETYDGPNIPEERLNKKSTFGCPYRFTTRRTTQDNVVWQTHQWVVMELAAAITLKKRVVEEREAGLMRRLALLRIKELTTPSWIISL